MNKLEFTSRLSDRLSIPRKECVKMVNTCLELMSDELRMGNAILFHGFGSLDAWKQTGRIGRNPRTGEPYPIHPRTSVKFKPGKTLLDRLNKK